MEYLLDRLREPSTYASLAAVLGTLGVSLSPGIVQALTLAGVGIAGAIGILVAEKE